MGMVCPDEKKHDKWPDKELQMWEKRKFQACKTNKLTIFTKSKKEKRARNYWNPNNKAHTHNTTYTPCPTRLTHDQSTGAYA